MRFAATNVDFKAINMAVCASWSVSKTRRRFVAEPMSEKPVTALAGIGPALAENLKKQDITYCYQLLGYFLIYKKCKDKFIKEYKLMSKANDKQAEETYSCLSEWADKFI